MRIINKDLTKESIHIYITNNQVYAEIHNKTHGKWVMETFLKEYIDIDEDTIKSTIKYIIRTFGLKNPKVTIE